MAGLNRRDFLKALGLSGVTAAGACNHGLDTNRYRTPIEDVLPYVVKPEQVTPGTPTYFATTLASGPDAYPVLAHHRDGRVINVASNPKSGMNRGVPKSAFLELQKMYSPDRLRAPQQGDASIDWDTGLKALADAVAKATQAGKTVAYLGPHQSGPMAQLLNDYTDGNAYFWEPTGHAAQASAYEALFGARQLPQYDLSNAEFILSFGAQFLSWWGNPEMEAQYAKARNPNHGHFVTQFALVSPHMDQTGANADDWYPCRSGSEAHVAFAIAKLIAAKKGYSGQAAAILDGIDVAAAASQSNLAESEIDAVASLFAEAGTAVALPGCNDGDLAVATYLINLVSGNGGKSFLSGGYDGPIHGGSDIAQLVADMNAGAVDVLLLGDSNPVYSLPSTVGFAEAMGKVGLITSLSGHPDETNASAQLHLPASSSFEDWGLESPRQGVLLLRQPGMTPLWDTRSVGDILLATARSAGLNEARTAAKIAAVGEEAEPSASPFEAADWRTYVMSSFITMSESASYNDALQTGTSVRAPANQAPAISDSSYRFKSRTLSDGVDVVLYAHPHRYDGRYANQPWAQEVADPMTGHVWDSWLEVSSDLVSSYAKGSEVQVKSGAGSIAAGVVPYRGLASNTIAIALGQGHISNGRYANGTGVNAFAISSGQADSFGNHVLNGLTATLTATGNTSDLVTTFGQDAEDINGLGYESTKGGDGKRDWGVSVNAEQLAESGDAPQADPHQVGWLTGIHHLARDERLIKANELDFYGEPDHPTYRFGMSIDTNACNGCGACVIACYAENNLPVVGKPLMKKGREMNWLRINRYWEETPAKTEGGRPQYDVQFVPMMCQHCGHAPCESVCPVLATYHNVDGLNAMVYNRCVGTRYCANNCPYVVRRFNFHSYKWPEPFNLQLNPELSVRTMGVMEKCTFCVQRTRNVKIAYRNANDGKDFTAKVPDSALTDLPACANSCPTDAIVFGDRNSSDSKVSQLAKSARSYEILAELNVKSAVNYLAKANHHKAAVSHHGGHGEDHGDSHGAAHGAAHDDKKPQDDHAHGHDNEHHEPSGKSHEGGH